MDERENEKVVEECFMYDTAAAAFANSCILIRLTATDTRTAGSLL